LNNRHFGGFWPGDEGNASKPERAKPSVDDAFGTAVALSAATIRIPGGRKKCDGISPALHRRERSRREKKRAAPPPPTNQDSEPAPAIMPGYIFIRSFFHFFCTLFTIQSPIWNSKDEKNEFNGFENFFQIRKSKKMI
jgi:hypothetical protein